MDAAPKTRIIDVYLSSEHGVLEFSDDSRATVDRAIAAEADRMLDAAGSREHIYAVADSEGIYAVEARNT